MDVDGKKNLDLYAILRGPDGKVSEQEISPANSVVKTYSPVVFEVNAKDSGHLLPGIYTLEIGTVNKKLHEKEEILHRERISVSLDDAKKSRDSRVP